MKKWKCVLMILKYLKKMMEIKFPKNDDHIIYLTKKLK